MTTPTRVPVALVSYDNGRAKVVKLRGDDAKRGRLVDLLAKRSERRKSIAGQPSSEDIRSALQDALNDQITGGSTWVRDFSASWVVYDVYGSDGGAVESGCFVAAWDIDASGEVILGEPTEVEAHTTYEAKDDDPASLNAMPTLPVYKRGARNSAADLKTIQGMHDGSVALGASCGMAKSSNPILKATVGPVVKSDEEKRYTFGPLYVASPPGSALLDAHGDYATAEDIQEAVWGYVAKGDLALRDQHTAALAGQVVEVVCWPWDVTVPVTKADGSAGFEVKTFPAGTAFMGAVWTEKGWGEVKAGLKTGWSLGGSAVRTETEVSE